MTIRSARPEDADFIAQTILSSQRGYRPRGWFDVALGLPEAQCREFVARIVVARAVSMWHVSEFLVAEIDDNLRLPCVRYRRPARDQQLGVPSKRSLPRPGSPRLSLPPSANVAATRAPAGFRAVRAIG